MDYYCLNQIGTRENNEDSVGVFQNSNMSVFIVADGLGGHSKGEVASKIAVKTAEDLIADNVPFDRFVDSFFTECSARLIAEQDRDRNQSAIKTTVVMAIYDGSQLEIAHVGDSRCYYFRKNKVSFRTLDHSVPQMLVMTGDIPEKKIRNHPDRNRLLKVMGERDLLRDGIKLYDTRKIENIEPGDSFLLCTDGFWELILERQMEKTLKRTANDQEWMNAMERIVIKNGRKKDMDNYSAICVTFQ